MGDAKGMSAKDKADFGATCSARWPCEAAAVHSYVSPCPIGWLLEGNSVCVPPDNSSCGTAPANLTVREKQHLEAACGCSWPDADVCTKDYSRSCPTGWFEGDGECTAAPGYDRCGTVQRFGGWSVAEKMSWEANVGLRGRVSFVSAAPLIGVLRAQRIGFSMRMELLASPPTHLPERVR